MVNITLKGLEGMTYTGILWLVMFGWTSQTSETFFNPQVIQGQRL